MRTFVRDPAPTRKAALKQPPLESPIRPASAWGGLWVITSLLPFSRTCGPGSSCEAEGDGGWWGTPVICLHRWPLSHSVPVALLLTMGWAQLQKGQLALGVACAGGAHVHGHIDSGQPPEHQGH